MTEGSEAITLSHARELLEKAKKERGEMHPLQEQALQHAKKFGRIPKKKADELVKSLLSIEWIEEPYAFMCADLLPSNEDTVKLIFSKSRQTLREEQVKQILELVQKYI